MSVSAGQTYQIPGGPVEIGSTFVFVGKIPTGDNYARRWAINFLTNQEYEVTTFNFLFY